VSKNPVTVVGEELIQICANPSEPETLSRELRALESSAKEHPRAKRRLLVLDRDALVRLREQAVDAQPAYEWLLSHFSKDRI
jgi:hypothetical protein